MSDLLQRVPPQNLEAEQSVLGAVLLDNRALDEFMAWLPADAFYREAHRSIYRAMLALNDRNQPVDAITLTEALRGDDTLELIGGPAYIAELAAIVPTAANVAYYGRIVRDKAVLRNIASTATAIASGAYDNPSDAPDFADDSARKMAAATDMSARSEVRDSMEYVKAALAAAEAAYERGGMITGLPTGFTDLDRLTGGLQPSDLIILAARPSRGKAQPLDAKVLTPDGFVAMGDMRVGAAVIGRDGRPHRVLGVYPQGEKEVFSVEFSDGTKTECCNEHLWETSTRDERRAVTRNNSSVKSLAEIRQTLHRPHSGSSPNHSIPIVAPVEFKPQEAPYPLSARLLGLLLGDGKLGASNVCFFKPEADLLAEVCALLPAEDCAMPIEGGLRIRRRVYNGESAETAKAIDLLGLRCGATNKFIPRQYLYGTIAERFELLAGLLDTDGSVTAPGKVEYSTSSKQLAEDVCQLVRSLGGIAHCATRETQYAYKGERRTGAQSWRLSIRFFGGLVPVKSAKHLARWRTPKRQEHRSIVAIRSMGTKPCQCISVDSADGLYVTDDFIVTHNTALGLNIAANVAIRDKKHVLFFSLEMSGLALGLRLLCSEARLGMQKVRGGFLGSKDFPLLASAISTIADSGGRIIINDESGLSPLAVKAIARRANRLTPLSLIVIDYIQLMTPAKGYKDSREREVAEISKSLKALAKELKIPVLALAQLNRQTESRVGGRPTLADLRESGAIEQDADVVMFLHDPEAYKKQEDREPNAPRELIVGKARNGPTGDIKVAFFNEYTRFDNYSDMEMM